MARMLVTSHNLSPLVVIVTWFLCFIAVLSMLARGATKVIFARPIKPDDFSSLGSLSLSIAQSVAVTFRTANGLGKQTTALHTTGVSAYSKATYAANILYISSMCLSELSVVLFIRNITPVRQDRRILFIAGSFTILWAIIGLVGSAVECGSRTPWNYFNGHCINHVMWWNCVEVMNVLINVALIALPVWIISKVQIPLLRKTSVGLIFALRTSVCVASICKLVYLNKAQYSHDLTFEAWPVTICTQTIQCMSIASFCFLYLKPLFEILDSGVTRTDEFRRKGQLKAGGRYNVFRVSFGKDGRKGGKTLARLAQTGDDGVPIAAFESDSG